MKKSLLFIILSFGLMSQMGCLQQADEVNGCYSDKLADEETVFVNLVNKPHFKGGHDSLVRFLSENIDLEQFAANLSRNTGTYTDTARLRFIVNKHGGISQLSIKTAGQSDFADELTRVIKKSSCNWVAGSSEQPSNGWYQFDIYYSIEKLSEKDVKTMMTINEI